MSTTRFWCAWGSRWCTYLAGGDGDESFRGVIAVSSLGGGLAVLNEPSLVLARSDTWTEHEATDEARYEGVII